MDIKIKEILENMEGKTAEHLTAVIEMSEQSGYIEGLTTALDAISDMAEGQDECGYDVSDIYFILHNAIGTELFTAKEEMKKTTNKYSKVVEFPGGY